MALLQQLAVERFYMMLFAVVGPIGVMCEEGALGNRFWCCLDKGPPGPLYGTASHGTLHLYKL